jgi:hypothetical protein
MLPSSLPLPRSAHSPERRGIHAVCLPHFLSDLAIANGSGLLLDYMPITIVHGQR